MGKFQMIMPGITRFGKTGVIYAHGIAKLPADKQARIAYMGEKYKNDYSRVLSCGDVKIPENGKPFFSNHEEIGFSVSHSGDWWIMAVLRGTVGIDIQRHDSGRDMQAIAGRFFHRGETAVFDGSEADFYRLWCRKEACVKYTGDGLSAFSRFSGEEAAEYIGQAKLENLAMPAGYGGAICFWEG